MEGWIGRGCHSAKFPLVDKGNGIYEGWETFSMPTEKLVYVES